MDKVFQINQIADHIIYHEIQYPNNVHLEQILKATERLEQAVRELMDKNKKQEILKTGDVVKQAEFRQAAPKSQYSPRATVTSERYDLQTNCTITSQYHVEMDSVHTLMDKCSMIDGKVIKKIILVDELEYMIKEQEEWVTKLRAMKNSSSILITLNDLKTYSKEVFGLMMRAHLRNNDGDKFQPCKDEIKFLKSIGKGSFLCAYLRHVASLCDFYKILHPGEGENCLDNKDSIFHLHQYSVRKDIKEFNDLTLRANKIANELVKSTFKKINITLLDGHGRMLVCLLKALALYNEDLLHVESIRIYEISEVVYEYHNLVFPDFIKNINGSIIRGLNPKYESEIQTGSFIYMNFCSIPTTADINWTAHFNKQKIEDWTPACSKENVLRYIWKVIHPPYFCTVMISCVIKHMLKPKEYCHVFKETLGNYVTGLGFLWILLNIFNAELVSIRPENEIQWEYDQEKRIPTSLRSGKRGCPFVTLLVRPRCSTNESLIGIFEEMEIADMQEKNFQIGTLVKVNKGKHVGVCGKIERRTPAQVCVQDKRINITKIEIHK